MTRLDNTRTAWIIRVESKWQLFLLNITQVTRIHQHRCVTFTSHPLSEMLEIFNSYSELRACHSYEKKFAGNLTKMKLAVYELGYEKTYNTFVSAFEEASVPSRQPRMLTSIHYAFQTFTISYILHCRLKACISCLEKVPHILQRLLFVWVYG